MRGLERGPEGLVWPADRDETSAVLDSKARGRVPDDGPSEPRPEPGEELATSYQDGDSRQRSRQGQGGRAGEHGDRGAVRAAGAVAEGGPCTTSQRHPESRGNWLVLGARPEAIRSCCAEKRHGPADISARRCRVEQGLSGTTAGAGSEDGTAVGILSERVTAETGTGNVWPAVETAKGERGSESECI